MPALQPPSPAAPAPTEPARSSSSAARRQKHGSCWRGGAAPPVAVARRAGPTCPPASHPRLSPQPSHCDIQMVKTAVKSLKERTGSSAPAIAKYIGATYKVKVGLGWCYTMLHAYVSVCVWGGGRGARAAAVCLALPGVCRHGAPSQVRLRWPQHCVPLQHLRRGAHPAGACLPAVRKAHQGLRDSRGPRPLSHPHDNQPTPCRCPPVSRRPSAPS